MLTESSYILNFIKKYWKNILLFLSLIIIIILLMNTTCINNSNKNLQNNIKALTDSVQVLELKNGNLLHEKQSLILEKKEIEKYLDISNKEIKEIEKQLNSSLALISELKTNIRIDTIITTDSLIISNNNDTIIAHFRYNDKWITLNGYTKIIDNDKSNTQINDLLIDVPLTIGLTNDYKVFATSDNPYVSFTSVNAASIENSISNNKHKRWGFGPYVGFGVNFGYDPFHNGAGITLGGSVGFCVTYNLFQW